ncbi:hypothetical protein PanWU01x14_012870, partial [Parasponia andersonii]
MDFTKVTLWVQFHNVLNVFKSDRCASLISQVIDADLHGPILYARIVIDVTKPLYQGLR